MNLQLCLDRIQWGVFCSLHTTPSRMDGILGSLVHSQYISIKINSRTITLFVGPLILLLLTSDGLFCHLHIMDSSDSSFSTTPANLLAASMAANPFSHLFFQGQVEGQDYKFESRYADYHCEIPLRGIFLVVKHVVGFKESPVCLVHHLCYTYL